MAKLNEIYKCEICGDIIEVIHEGQGKNLVCCGKPMVMLKENTVDASKEKHVPVIEKTKNGFLVKVGAIPHPMESAHYIEFIEIIADGVSYKKFLKPGEKPEAEFCITATNVVAREFCNLHGLWKA